MKCTFVQRKICLKTLFANTLIQFVKIVKNKQHVYVSFGLELTGRLFYSET